MRAENKWGYTTVLGELWAFGQIKMVLKRNKKTSFFCLPRRGMSIGWERPKGFSFWTHAVAFTSKDQNLNKTHVQLLESRLVELAKAAKRCVLGNSPQSPSLSEVDLAEAEGFLADVLLCLPVLGYGFFEPAPSPNPITKEFFLSAKGLSARGYETANGFVVRQGSQAAKVEVPSIHGYLRDLQQSLIAQNVFADKASHYELVQDYSFNSPSTAAGVFAVVQLTVALNGKPRTAVLSRQFRRKRLYDESRNNCAI